MANYAQSGRGYSSRNKNYQETDKKIKWHWSLNVTIAGILIGGILSLWIITFSKLTYLNLFLFILAVGTLATLIQWKFFYSQKFIQKYFRIHIVIFLIYNYLGIGFGTAGTGLLVNWIGSSGDFLIEKHNIVGNDTRYVWDSSLACPLLLENDAYADDPEYRSFPYVDAVKFKQNPILEIAFYPGLFGIPVFYGKRMVPDPHKLSEEGVSVSKDKEKSKIKVEVTTKDSSGTSNDTIKLEFNH